MSRGSLTIHISQRQFGILCLVGYVALSWVARFDMRLGQQIASLSYPFDTFSMYAGTPGHDTSHLLVRDRQGMVHRVEDFQSFRCDEPLTGSAVQCAGKTGIPYHYEDLTRYIESHAGPGDVEVELITRTWNFTTRTAPVPTSDCVVAHCKVGR